MSPLIQCQHVDFGYDNQDAVIDVNMEVDPGDYLCIVGENGSGKSTLMKGLLGLIKPAGGKLVTAEELKRTGIGYLLILDEPITGLDPTAIQEFYAMIRRLNREDKVAILMVSHDLRNAVEEANKILHLQKRVLFYGPAHDYMNSQAAGHFFHEKEQGRCKPTAGCHAVKLHMHKEEKS